MFSRLIRWISYPGFVQPAPVHYPLFPPGQILKHSIVLDRFIRQINTWKEQRKPTWSCFNYSKYDQYTPHYDIRSFDFEHVVVIGQIDSTPPVTPLSKNLPVDWVKNPKTPCVFMRTFRHHGCKTKFRKILLGFILIQFSCQSALLISNLNQS